MKFDCVCFDLDGTICDSKPGILNGLRYAFEKLGEPEQTDEYFLKFIGLSLDKSLAKFTNFSDDKIIETITVFREYYGEQGIFDGDLYPEITNTIKNIQEAGSKIYLVTAKPQHFAEEILDHFGLLDYFDGIFGLIPDEEYPGKTAHINDIKALGNYLSLIMIGDRHMDIDAANETNSTSIAVTYGYGDKEELDNAKPTYFAANCKEIEQIII